MGFGRRRRPRPRICTPSFLVECSSFLLLVLLVASHLFSLPIGPSSRGISAFSVYDALHALILVLFLQSSCCNGLHRSCSFNLSNTAANSVWGELLVFSTCVDLFRFTKVGIFVLCVGESRVAKHSWNLGQRDYDIVRGSCSPGASTRIELLIPSTSKFFGAHSLKWDTW